mgnify:FL=1
MKKFNQVMTLSVATMLLLNPASVLAMTKNETIYSTLNYNGVVKKTTINTRLSDLEKGSIVDYTKLDDIKNINGREKFSLDSGTLTWKSTGKDIFYQGKVTEELPIKVTAKYYLNGEEVNPKKIKGKSGDVKIVYSFTNESYDKSSGMYTPFVVTTTSIINSDNNTDIDISSGKVVNTGTKNIVTGISAPGLYDSVGLSELKDMDKVTITYNTTKFSMNEVYFVITPKLLSEVDVNMLSKVDSLNSSLNTLQNGMNELQNGSSTLNDGAKKIENGTKSLNDGLKSASVGMEQVNSGASELNSKVTSINSLVNALVDIMTNGNSTDSEVMERVNYEKQVINSYDATILPKLDQLQTLYLGNVQAINTLKATNESISQVYNQYSLGNFKLDSTDTRDLPILSEYFTNLLMSQGMSSEEIKSTITNLTTVKKTYEGNLQLITLLEGNNQALLTSKDLIGTVSSKLSELNDGTNKLSSGTKQINDGLTKLYSGSNELLSGTSSLSNGTNTLNEGIIKINSEGISKLTEYGNKAVTYKNKVKTLTNLSKNYKGFASDNSDSTLFIYKISK